MAEDAAAPAPAPEAEQTSSEPIKYDESLLVIVKGKVQQPKQPDHTESRLLISKLQAEISKRADRIKEIKAIEEQLRGRAKEGSAGNQELIKKLQALRGERGAILKAKASVREELRSTDATRDAIRTELRSIRDKSKHVNPEKLEEEIAQVEFRLQHESLSEADEKRAQSHVSTLRAARPLAQKYGEFEARLKEVDAQRASIVKRLQDSDAELKVVDEAIAAQNAVLDEARAKADVHREDLPSLQVEKKENYEICVVLRSKIDELKKKNDEEYQEYIKRDRAFRGYQREQRRLKYEERQREREAREKERAEMQQEAGGSYESAAEPYQSEVMTCDSLILYLHTLAGTGAKEEVAKVEVKEVEVPAGLKPFKRADDLDGIFAGLGKKAKPAKGKGGSAAAAPSSSKAPEPAKPKVTKMNFTLETLQTFLKLGVDVPQTSDQLGATIEKVEAKKQHFLELRQKKKDAPANGHGRGGSSKAAAAAEAEASGSGAADEAEPEPEAGAADDDAEEPAAPAPADEAEEAAEAAVEEAAVEDAPAPPASGDVGVRLSVTGESVSLAITAA